MHVAVERTDHDHNRPGLVEARRVGRLVTRRLVLFAITLWLVLSLTWILTRVLGGNPAIALAGPSATREAVQHIEVQLGINKPLLAQYFSYLGKLVRGDFG